MGRLREARGEQQRGRSRLTVALVGAARQGRLARPRCARPSGSSLLGRARCDACEIHRSIDPDQIQVTFGPVTMRWRPGYAGAAESGAGPPGRLAGRADRTRLLGRAKARERSPTTPLARAPGVHRTLGAPRTRAPACRADGTDRRRPAVLDPMHSAEDKYTASEGLRQQCKLWYTYLWIDTSAQRTMEQLCGCVRRLALCPRRAPRYISAAIV